MDRMSFLLLLVFATINLFVFVEGVLSIAFCRVSAFESLIVYMLKHNKRYPYFLVVITCSVGYAAYGAMLMIIAAIIRKRHITRILRYNMQLQNMAEIEAAREQIRQYMINKERNKSDE